MDTGADTRDQGKALAMTSGGSIRTDHASRHETGSVIVTSNLPFARWGETLGDDVVAAATIDRLARHAHVIPPDGDSHRTRAHRKTK